MLGRELTAQEVERRIAASADALQGIRRLFRLVPEVAAWITACKEVADRRKFLVLDGPSRLGKTQFAMSLVPHGQGLEVLRRPTSS